MAKNNEIWYSPFYCKTIINDFFFEIDCYNYLYKKKNFSLERFLHIIKVAIIKIFHEIFWKYEIINSVLNGLRFVGVRNGLFIESVWIILIFSARLYLYLSISRPLSYKSNCKFDDQISLWVHIFILFGKFFPKMLSSIINSTRILYNQIFCYICDINKITIF